HTDIYGVRCNAIASGPSYGAAHDDQGGHHHYRRRLLRYTAEIVNVGVGPFEALGSRDSSTADMTVSQSIYDDAGGKAMSPIGDYMFWAGDGHNHWHLADLEGGVLTSYDDGVQVGRPPSRNSISPTARRSI